MKMIMKPVEEGKKNVLASKKPNIVMKNVKMIYQPIMDAYALVAQLQIKTHGFCQQISMASVLRDQNQL
jgi:hypothetical protein